jgi:hypothetical protein
LPHPKNEREDLAAVQLDSESVTVGVAAERIKYDVFVMFWIIYLGAVIASFSTIPYS